MILVVGWLITSILGTLNISNVWVDGWVNYFNCEWISDFNSRYVSDFKSELVM
ncbi:9280_t:CDS:2, partial [Gigaspora margarita]